jgi:uncharacterized repeat protein (TIGR02543 family)
LNDVGTLVALFVGCDTPTVPEPKTAYYAVTYLGNGNSSGAVPVDTNKYPQGSSVTVLDKGTLARTGYVFLAWNTSQQGNGASYAPNDTILIGSNISLYAMWDSIHTVTFDCNGGSEIQSVLGLLSGKKITKPDNPEKQGFVFEGWYKDAQYGEAWDFDNDVVNNNITLYAKWKGITYTVTFECNGGTGFQQITGLLAGSRINNPGKSFKSGYVFDGWYKNPELTEAWSFYEVITDNTTLYAKWLDMADSIVVLVPSVDVIHKYPNGTVPQTISCLLRTYATDGSTAQVTPPIGWVLLYRTSTGSYIQYTDPITMTVHGNG